MKTIKKASLLFASLALVLGAGLFGNSDTKEVKAAEVITTDTITADKLTATGTTYKDFSEVTINSSAVYAGNNAKNNVGAIQLRSSNSNSGIVSTASGGILKSISIVVSSGTKTLDIYGANSAYSSASDLYKSATQGKKLGSLSSTGTFNFPEDITYQFIGLRSNSGALYLSSIEISWSNASLDDPTPIINLINKIGTVEYSDTCKARIDKARSAYDNAPDLQSKVTNYSVLTAAEARYAELKEEADMEVAIGVEDKIDALPAINDINDNSKVDDIYSVNDEYQKLTDDQKVFVSKDRLTKLEGLLEKLKEYPLSVEQAIAKANQTGTTATNYEYYIKGIVCEYDKTSTGKNKNFDTFKNLTFKISDDGTNSNTFMAYQANYLNKQQFESMDQIALGDIVVICGKILNYNNNTPETTGQGTAYVYSHTSAVSTFVAKVKSFDLCNASAEELKAMLDEYDALIAKNADAANSVVDETTTLAERMDYMQLVYNKKANTTGKSTSGVVITSNNSYDKTSLIALFAILGIVTISGYYIIEKKKFSK